MKLWLILFFLPLFPTIYGLDIHTIDGNEVHLDSFASKRILLVNVATNSTYTHQLDSLEKLYQIYKDSLIIIAVPSNSFGNEPRDSVDISNYIIGHHNVSFLITEKMEVTSPNQSPLYEWLTSKTINGVLQSEVKNDFQKYLVDKDGTLLGIFSSAVDPLSPQLTNAIEGN